MNGTLENGLILEDLRAYLVAADSGSLNAAAKALGQPKSTLSRRLARLEQQLGTRLFRRTARGLVATDAGRVVLDPARAILDDIASLTQLAREGMAEPRGRLRISAPQDLAGMGLWMEFAQRHPQVTVEIEFTNRYADLVREGFDVALRGGRGDDDALIVRRVGSYALRAVATPQWLADNGPVEDSPAFRSLDCVLFAPFRPRATTARTRRSARRRRYRHLIANDLTTVLDGALRGLGVAFLPDHLCAEAIGDGRLVTVLDAYDPFVVPLYATYPDKDYMPAAVTAFVDHVVETMDRGTPPSAAATERASG